MLWNLTKDLLVRIGLLEAIKKGEQFGRAYQQIRLGPLVYVFMLSTVIVGIVCWDFQIFGSKLESKLDMSEKYETVLSEQIEEDGARF